MLNRSEQSNGDIGDARNGTADMPGVTPEEIADLVDSISGATWETRNEIMAQRFRDKLERDAGRVPIFKPPGESLRCDE